MKKIFKYLVLYMMVVLVFSSLINTLKHFTSTNLIYAFLLQITGVILMILMIVAILNTRKNLISLGVASGCILIMMSCVQIIASSTKYFESYTISFSIIGITLFYLILKRITMNFTKHPV